MSSKNTELIGNDITIVNQILPHTNKWAFDLFLKGCANNWMPTSIGMQKDIVQWKSPSITDDEKLVIKRCLGFFAGSESLVGNNLLLSIFKYITDAECRMYISRQQFEESLHNLTVVYCCDSLGLNIKEVYEAYNSIPAIKAKDDFLMEITANIHSNKFDITSKQGKQDLLKNLFIYYIICEGIFFYSGFAMLLSFGRQNKFPGISEQIQYTLRDEVIHIEFGTNLIKKIKHDYPEIWTAGFQKQMMEYIDKAVELEIKYSEDVLPRGILGLNSTMFIDYIKYIANRRLTNLNLPEIYSKASSPFPWMSEIIDLPKVKNFFETRVTEYQSGTIVDDL